MSDVNMKYISDNTQRVLRVQNFLVGHEVRGVTPGDIAKSTNITPSNVTRALHNLLLAELVERHPQIKGHWRLSVSSLIRISNSIARGVDQSQAAVFDAKRYLVER